MFTIAMTPVNVSVKKYCSSNKYTLLMSFEHSVNCEEGQGSISNKLKPHRKHNP